MQVHVSYLNDQEDVKETEKPVCVCVCVFIEGWGVRSFTTDMVMRKFIFKEIIFEMELEKIRSHAYKELQEENDPVLG